MVCILSQKVAESKKNKKKSLQPIESQFWRKKSFLGTVSMKKITKFDAKSGIPHRGHFILINCQLFSTNKASDETFLVWEKNLFSCPKFWNFHKKNVFFYLNCFWFFFSGNIYVTFEKNEVSNDNGHKEAQSFQSKASIYLKI